jgi:hypothetical protein
MSAYIRKYVVECDLCQRNKNENVSTPKLLHPLQIPNQKWEEISIDFIEGLPISNGKDKILVVVDRLTKYAHFIGVRKTDSTKQMAEIFYKNIYKLHGFPNVIVGDRDAKFKGILEIILQTYQNLSQYELSLPPSNTWLNKSCQ